MSENRNYVLNAMRDVGAKGARALRAEAAEMTGTQIIDQEQFVPDYDPERDYSAHPVGTPVSDGGQVWTLLQPHNAAHYQSRPETLRALWNLCHTTDPIKAKPWTEAYGSSGMYMKDECYLAPDGTVYRAKQNNLVHDAVALPDAWEKVILE